MCIRDRVGTGKTSICRNLLKYIPNSIVLHAGNIYRAITYQIIKENIPKEKINHIDLKELFENFEIEIKIENCETVVYAPVSYTHLKKYRRKSYYVCR